MLKNIHQTTNEAYKKKETIFEDFRKSEGES